MIFKDKVVRKQRKIKKREFIFRKKKFLVIQLEMKLESVEPFLRIIKDKRFNKMRKFSHINSDTRKIFKYGCIIIDRIRTNQMAQIIFSCIYLLQFF